MVLFSLFSIEVIHKFVQSDQQLNQTSTMESVSHQTHGFHNSPLTGTTNQMFLHNMVLIRLWFYYHLYKCKWNMLTVNRGHKM